MVEIEQQVRNDEEFEGIREILSIDRDGCEEKIAVAKEDLKKCETEYSKLTKFIQRLNEIKSLSHLSLEQEYLLESISYEADYYRDKIETSKRRIAHYKLEILKLEGKIAG